MQPKNTTLEEAELSLKLRMMLDFRFGDGSGEPNWLIDQAYKEILSFILHRDSQVRESERSALVELIKKEGFPVFGKGSEVGLYHDGQRDLATRLIRNLLPHQKKEGV